MVSKPKTSQSVANEVVRPLWKGNFSNHTPTLSMERKWDYFLSKMTTVNVMIPFGWKPKNKTI